MVVTSGRSIHTRSRGTYVERRVHAELAALGVHVGRNEGGRSPSGSAAARNTGERTSAVRFELLAD